MTTIWKYELDVTDVQRVKMPEGAMLLHVGAQVHTLCMWALVDPLAAVVNRLIAVVGTGNPAPGPIDVAVYVGSAQVGSFVWHVFDGGEVPLRVGEVPVGSVMSGLVVEDFVKDDSSGS